MKTAPEQAITGPPQHSAEPQHNRGDIAQIHIEDKPLQDHKVKIPQINSEKYTFQDNTSKVKCQSTDKHALQDPTTKCSKKQSFQDHNISVKDVQDIISLKIAFPHLFDTTGNVPGVYTICLDPSVPQFNMQDVRSP